MNRISRRHALGLGAAAGAGVVLSSTAVAPASAAPATTPTRFTLTSAGLQTVGAKPRPAVGDPLTLRGEVVDETGAVRGEVYGSGTHLVAGHHSDPDQVASLQSHLFVLAGGTLTGHGTVDRAGRGNFTVTGGTGEFLGAHGAYTSTQHADRVGGAATFLFDLHRSAL